MIAPRYAVPVALALSLALLPTVIHSYRGMTLPDGRSAAAIPGTLGEWPSSPTTRRPAWVAEVFDSTDWVERVYRVGSDEVKLFVGRSYDAKRLYHHPELALLRGTETHGAGIAYAAARPDVPLHVLTAKRQDQEGVAVYALLSDGRFVGNPIAFQLRTSTELLFSGRRPLTLFMASDLAGRVDQLDAAPATRVLLAAIGAFEGQRPADALPDGRDTRAEHPEGGR